MGIRAVYKNGVFKPLDDVNLPEGTEVEVVVTNPREIIKKYAGILRELREAQEVDWEEAYHEHILKRASNG
ncbi:antitoxin family protein [Thermococcus sp.]|uniref:antitoxin family protein n=1 Tax=Thermococcus sp. TaxID=35749 RepID=UPI00261B79FB|nr:antitoxin family protein [Thermococcus sp.]